MLTNFIKINAGWEAIGKVVGRVALHAVETGAGLFLAKKADQAFTKFTGGDPEPTAKESKEEEDDITAAAGLDTFLDQASN